MPSTELPAPQKQAAGGPVRRSPVRRYPATVHALELTLLGLALCSTVLNARGSRLPPGPAVSTQSVATPYIVLIDAAHGGRETGARLTSQLLEKDYTLALSVRLRSSLSAHGVHVVTTRESDTVLTPEARAGVANRSHASACLLLHATTSGTGVHLYTSSLSRGLPLAAGALRPWTSAQAGYLTESLKLSSDVRQALAHAGIPVTLGSVSLAPVDSMACPALVLEVAPLLPARGKTAALLGDAGYETRLVDALDGAMEQWRADGKIQ